MQSKSREGTIIEVQSQHNKERTTSYLHALHAAAVLDGAQALGLGGEEGVALEAGEGLDGARLRGRHCRRGGSEGSRGHRGGGSNNGRHCEGKAAKLKF